MPNADGKLEKIHAIKIGKGMQHILDQAYEIIGNPILTHDMEYNLVAHNKNDNDDPIWNEYMRTGSASQETLVFFRDECFLEAAANAKKCTFLYSDKLQYRRIFGKVFTSGNIQIGAACIVETSKPFEEGDIVLFEAVCDMLCLEGCKSKHYRRYGQAYMEDFIATLIEGPMDDSDIYTAHLESLYNGLESTLRLAVVDIPKSVFWNCARVRDVLKRARPEYKYALYAGFLTIIMSSENAAFREDEALRGLRMYLRLSNARVGVSHPFENLHELPERFQEARHALGK